jgi:hypothetical protein
MNLFGSKAQINGVRHLLPEGRTCSLYNFAQTRRAPS